MFSLVGKGAVVIGGGGHICSALSKGFASMGAKVMVADLRIEKAKGVANQISNEFGDVSAFAEVDATSKNSLSELLEISISTLGSIEILVNGAGINSAIPFFDIETQSWNDVVSSQLSATMLGCQIFGKHMVNRGYGSIINVSSASADPALSRAFAYSASKAAIKNLTQNLGREWAMNGVRVNALRPGFFPTEWNRKNFIDQRREESILNHTPMKRFGEPEELVGAAIYLASDAARFVTGSELVVDGGFSCMSI
jgi:NAD(P)-dependent dehydrogenase (short-subunit alcohol dehydrogenase family)